LAAWAAGAAPASAQSGGSDPVISAYREYKAAEARKDLAGAEAAAARALAASDARDGDGKLTAVLAMNLAIVMMDRDEKAQAIAPARRAYTLASAGAKGVDPLMARLVLGEAELATISTGEKPFSDKLQKRPSLPRLVKECERTLHRSPDIHYPNQMVANAEVGAAVLRLAIDGQGNVIKSELLTAFPKEQIQSAIKKNTNQN
jgi:hypothetical protein